ncbi:hypothetical protein SAMN04487943_106193 [Gracilibacillus orientalis]|uniref:Uncharacterized protein n=1 Tax=Gracilibacillus orientalis TaxID=334253 RepID=A0A1I4MDT1_9BACI|nr:hypothetical protein [Gracilibacillus orientalis]SFM01454.1 hypothetical protein SAMN04487943_106193 [Gracilibacillus orientalis]
MWKKYTIVIAIIACIGTVLLFVIKDLQKASLVETVKVEEQYEDFIVHIRIEETNNGFQVLRSIQYIGEEVITIQHRTPLTQITINADNATFTGSPISKQMKPGYQYHPQQPLNFSALEKGDHKLFVHTQFFIDEESVNIKTEETISFQ